MTYTAPLPIHLRPGRTIADPEDLGIGRGYRASGDTVEILRAGVPQEGIPAHWETYAVIDPTLAAPGTVEEIAAAVAEALSAGEVAEQTRKHGQAAALFAAATGAPGFRYVDPDDVR